MSNGFFAELKRRNVFRVGAGYAVVAWLLLQAADILLGNFGYPDFCVPLAETPPRLECER